MFRLPIRLINHKPAVRPLASRTLTVTASTKNDIKKVGDTLDNSDKASPEQLADIEQKLLQIIPKFFTVPHNYSIYTKDIKFIDNINNFKYIGISAYALRLTLVRIYFFINYTSSRVELLNLVKNPEESYIRIRWRIVSKPGLIKFALFFWKFRSTEIWKDGLSTMHVNSKGLIYCHVCDIIDEIKESDPKEKIGKSIKNPLVRGGLNV